MNTLALQTSPIQDALSLLGKEERSVREMRALIMGLEAAMQSMPEYVPGEDFETVHRFAPGIYMRQATIPAGFTVTGRIHKFEHLNILSQGVITVWTEDGMKTLSASTVIKSHPGIKRVGYAHADTVWITVHENADNCQDIKTIESRLFAETFEEAYLASKRTFDDAIRYLGFTAEEVKSISENTSDQIPFPDEVTGVQVSESPIHGKGLFALRRFEAGEVIAPGRIGGKRTPAGRFCNHSGNPNVESVMRPNGDVDMIALMEIDPGAEILNDYYLSFEKTRMVSEVLCLRS